MQYVNHGSPLSLSPGFRLVIVVEIDLQETPEHAFDALAAWRKPVLTYSKSLYLH